MFINNYNGVDKTSAPEVILIMLLHLSRNFFYLNFGSFCIIWIGMCVLLCHTSNIRPLINLKYPMNVKAYRMQNSSFWHEAFGGET